MAQSQGGQAVKPAPTATIISALRIIGTQIQSDDGAVQAALFEAAERMQALVDLTARQEQTNKALKAHLRRITDRASVLDDQVSNLIRHCKKHGVPVSSVDIIEGPKS
jgi:septal ring factor EnvC (AmiA/AmiB activator)